MPCILQQGYEKFKGSDNQGTKKV